MSMSEMWGEGGGGGVCVRRRFSNDFIRMRNAVVKFFNV